MNVERLEELLEELRKCDKEARAVDQMLAKPDMTINVLGCASTYLRAGDIQDALTRQRGALSARRVELVAAVRGL
ncbi:TPA: hypothetical protein NIF78_006296 [Pseudomonas aeruginosa]|nr:hypothetical protein [Pseudomonas aeruginosa]HCF4892867.1 hypothetical protein [Pseudomonas aeruginosa]HCF4933298.1 hypothetical protein [Pseudomonas aeruginosa]HCF5105330.1 hypothetical protein [Pseudomonas aeruginosa]